MRGSGPIFCLLLLAGTTLSQAQSSGKGPEDGDSLYKVPAGYIFEETVEFTDTPNHGRPHLHLQHAEAGLRQSLEEAHTILVTPDGRIYKRPVKESLEQLKQAEAPVNIAPSQSSQNRANVLRHSRKLTQGPTTTIRVNTSSDLSCNGCGPDNRVRVTATTTYPYMTVGQLIGQLGTSTVGLECTGTLIGNRHVVTAAHCVFDINGSRKMVANLNFAPAKNGNSAPYGNLQWTQARIVSQFRNQPGYTTTAMNYDFALVTLAEDATSGYLGLNLPPSNGITQKVPLQTAGYPGSKPSGTMWSSACGDTSVDYSTSNQFADVAQCANAGCSNILTHTCISSDGQSGSAMWDTDNNIRAILTGKVTTSDGDAFNVATEVDTEVYNQLASWYNEDGDSAGNGTLPLAPSGPGSQPSKQNAFTRFWTDHWREGWFIAVVVVIGIAAAGILYLVLVALLRCCGCCGPRAVSSKAPQYTTRSDGFPVLASTGNSSQARPPRYPGSPSGAFAPHSNEGPVQYNASTGAFSVNGRYYGQYQYPGTPSSR